MRSWVATLAIVGAASVARADDPPPPDARPGLPPDAPPELPPDAPPDDVLPPGDPTLGPPGASEPDSGDPDAAFGPLILIERVRIVGNRSTAERVIRRALPVAAGDRMRAGDPRLARARFKLLALGYFRDVTLELEKGSARGQVILTVTVSERGTIALNRLWFGSSALAPWWLGADVTERNFLGTGLSVGGGLAYADHAAVDGARDQWAGELRLGASAIAGTRWGAYGAFTGQHGSEPYRDEAGELHAFAYRRLGVRGGVRRDLRPTLHADAELRLEQIVADTPSETGVYVGVHDGTSRVASLRLGLDRDTRGDPVLPRDGSRLQLALELAPAALGADYGYVAGLARFETWWPIASRHAIGVRAAGGVVLADAPLFDRLHVADFDRLLTPRVLGLTVAAPGPSHLVFDDNDELGYGHVGGNLLVEYSYRWFRRPKTVYGGDLFVAAGVWSMAASQDEVSASARDVVIDAGLRLDTEVGVFEFTVANALGRFAR